MPVHLKDAYPPAGFLQKSLRPLKRGYVLIEKRSHPAHLCLLGGISREMNTDGGKDLLDETGTVLFAEHATPAVWCIQQAECLGYDVTRGIRQISGVDCSRRDKAADKEACAVRGVQRQEYFHGPPAVGRQRDKPGPHSHVCMVPSQLLIQINICFCLDRHHKGLSPGIMDQLLPRTQTHILRRQPPGTKRRVCIDPSLIRCPVEYGHGRSDVQGTVLQPVKGVVLLPRKHARSRGQNPLMRIGSDNAETHIHLRRDCGNVHVGGDPVKELGLHPGAFHVETAPAFEKFKRGGEGVLKHAAHIHRRVLRDILDLPCFLPYRVIERSDCISRNDYFIGFFNQAYPEPGGSHLRLCALNQRWCNVVLLFITGTGTKARQEKNDSTQLRCAVRQ